MFCPVCRVEHREGFTRCMECNVNLVKTLPPEPEPEYENLVPVFEGDSDSAAVARATVEGSGIESWTQDEEVHGLFPSMGLTEILVREEDEKPALTALEIPEHKKHQSNSRHSLDTSGADKRFASEDQVENSRKKRSKQNETSAKSHQDNCSRRQGKRV
jgi:hypothetical protein